MRRVGAVGSFLALVTGCGETAPTSPAPVAEAPRPARQSTSGFPQQFEWMRGSRGERGGLTFAVPETDNVGVTMECDRGSRSVRVSAADPDALGSRLVFGSGERRADVAASPSRDPEFDDSVYADARVAIDHPIFRAFRGSGELWVWDADAPMRSETDAEREAIEEFFDFCGD